MSPKRRSTLERYLRQIKHEQDVLNSHLSVAAHQLHFRRSSLQEQVGVQQKALRSLDEAVAATTQAFWSDKIRDSQLAIQAKIDRCRKNLELAEKEFEARKADLTRRFEELEDDKEEIHRNLLQERGRRTPDAPSSSSSKDTRDSGGARSSPAAAADGHRSEHGAPPEDGKGFPEDADDVEVDLSAQRADVVSNI